MNRSGSIELVGEKNGVVGVGVVRVWKNPMWGGSGLNLGRAAVNGKVKFYSCP